jgi:hypothetical protein
LILEHLCLILQNLVLSLLEIINPIVQLVNLFNRSIPIDAPLVANLFGLKKTRDP